MILTGLLGPDASRDHVQVNVEAKIINNTMSPCTVMEFRIRQGDFHIVMGHKL